jgi:CRP-like cAMP-binding protein
MPEFALMLMSVMAQRLRRGRRQSWPAANKAFGRGPGCMSHSLDRKMLADLQCELGSDAGAGAAGKVVVTKGAVGACMFVVTEGRIAISVDDKVIEHVGPGGTFGEMALVDRPAVRRPRPPKPTAPGC